jgi:hypothetical protein
MEGRIIKAKSKNNFTIIPNEPLQRSDISWKAKGLLCYLLSLPESWVLYKTELQNHSTDGRDSTTTGFDELVNIGYIEVEEVREKGRFKGFNYLVHSEPKTENPKTDLPKTENPKTEKPTLKRKQNINETEYKENIYFILNENLKIFQKNENEMYNYEAENFVIFKSFDLGFTKKIIVPEVFISDFFQKTDRVKFEGFLRNDFGSTPPAERVKEFEKLAKKAMAKFNAEILENAQHFINICRKIKDEPKKNNFQPKNTSRENDYKAGATNHSEGWT